MQDESRESEKVGVPEADKASESTGNGGRFYRGVIAKLFHGSMSGVVRSEKGRELPFFNASVRIMGKARRFDDLREGMRVGFDTGRTSQGLQITVLQVEE